MARRKDTGKLPFLSGQQTLSWGKDGFQKYERPRLQSKGPEETEGTGGEGLGGAGAHTLDEYLADLFDPTAAVRQQQHEQAVRQQQAQADALKPSSETAVDSIQGYDYQQVVAASLILRERNQKNVYVVEEVREDVMLYCDDQGDRKNMYDFRIVQVKHRTSDKLSVASQKNDLVFLAATAAEMLADGRNVRQATFFTTQKLSKKAQHSKVVAKLAAGKLSASDATKFGGLLFDLLLDNLDDYTSGSKVPALRDLRKKSDTAGVKERDKRIQAVKTSAQRNDLRDKAATIASAVRYMLASKDNPSSLLMLLSVKPHQDSLISLLRQLMRDVYAIAKERNLNWKPEQVVVATAQILLKFKIKNAVRGRKRDNDNWTGLCWRDFQDAFNVSGILTTEEQRWLQQFRERAQASVVAELKSNGELLKAMLKEVQGLDGDMTDGMNSEVAWGIVGSYFLRKTSFRVRKKRKQKAPKQQAQQRQGLAEPTSSEQTSEDEVKNLSGNRDEGDRKGDDEGGDEGESDDDKEGEREGSDDEVILTLAGVLERLRDGTATGAEWEAAANLQEMLGGSV